MLEAFFISQFPTVRKLTLSLWFKTKPYMACLTCNKALESLKNIPIVAGDIIHGRIVSKQEYKRRLNICKSDCEFYKATFCSICGCEMYFKSAFESMICLNGRW